jgi:phage antirepressor YoqD-like protein
MIEEARQLYTEPKEEIQTNTVTLSKIDLLEDYADAALTEAFEESAKTLPAGPCGRATSVNDWLRAATWWYCKVRSSSSQFHGYQS